MNTVREAARNLREKYQLEGQAALEFGNTIHCLSSAIGQLKDRASRYPAVARHYTSELASLSDELAELVGKLETRLKVVGAE